MPILSNFPQVKRKLLEPIFQRAEPITEAFKGVRAGLTGDAQGVNKAYEGFIQSGKRELPAFAEAYGQGMSVGSLGPIKGAFLRGDSKAVQGLKNELNKRLQDSTIVPTVKGKYMEILGHLDKPEVGADIVDMGNKLIDKNISRTLFDVEPLSKPKPRFTKGEKGLFSGSKPSSPLAQGKSYFHGTSKQSAEAIRKAGGFTDETAKSALDLTGGKVSPNAPVSMTLDKKTGKLYAGARPEGGTGELLEFKGNLKLATEAEAKKLGRYGLDYDKFINNLKKEGFDGYHTSSPHDEAIETVIFNKNKLKLVSPTLAQEVGRGKIYRYSETGLKIEPLDPKIQQGWLKKRWHRGVSQTNQGGDLFFSESKGVAGDYGAVRTIKPDELPRNPMIVEGDKNTIKDLIGYKGEPMLEANLPLEKRYDTLVKKYAQERGYDSIIYTDGTMESPELVIFSKLKGELKVK